jgi:ABC-2 type transport system permease protein
VNTLEITRLSLRRFARDRTATFFVVILPVVVIVVIGATVRGFGDFRVAVVDLDDGRLATEVVRSLEAAPGIDVTRFDAVDPARTSVRRAETSLAVVVPRGFSAELAAGRPATVAMVGDRASSTYQAAASTASSAIADVSARAQAAAFAVDEAGASFDHALDLSAGAAARATPIEVSTTSVDATSNVLPEGFSYSAPTMLVLFVFINALAAGATLIENRRLGVYERMAAGPVRRRSIIAGETLGYLAVALVQSALIVVVGRVAFGVSWGDPVAAFALIVTWALVGTGAGVLSGTLFRTPEQASSIGPALGVAFGMLGGCMWPLEIVSPVMRTLGHVAPHAWAVDAWTELLSRGGGLVAIAPQLAVLAGFAAVLLVAATSRLRHRLV